MKKQYEISSQISRRNSLILGFLLIFAFSWVKQAWPLIYIFLLLATMRGGIKYGSWCALSVLVSAAVNTFILRITNVTDLATHLSLILICVVLGQMFAQRRHSAEESPELLTLPDMGLPALPNIAAKSDDLLPVQEDLPYEIRQKRIQLKVSIDSSQKLDGLMSFINEYLKPHSLVLFLYDAGVNYLKINKALSQSSHFDRDVLISAGQGLVGWVARIQKPLSVKDLSRHKSSLLYYRGEHEVKSFLGVPIFADERFSGVLAVDSQESDRFTKEDEMILEWCGKQVTQIMMGAEERRRFLNQVSEVSLLYTASQELNASLNENEILQAYVKTASEIVGKEKTAFLGWVEDKGNLVVEADIGYSPGLVGHSEKLTRTNLLSWIISHRQPLRIHNIQDRLNSELQDNPLYRRMHSCIGLPLIVSEKLRGVLLLASRQRGRFTKVEQETLTILTNLAAFALSKAELYSQMEKMAITDGLTSLYNHQYFEKKIAQEMARARRYQKQLSLILLDIDHFKNINDHQGHLVGDEVLRLLGNLLREEMRDIDIASRYGGEEFVLILPETGVDSAMLVAERLRQKVESIFKKHTSINGDVTVSVGVGTYPLHGERQEELLEKVDEALYAAKNNGRNQTVSCNDLDKITA